MTSSPPSVVYVVPDKLGGMLNIIANLLAWRRADGFSHHAVLVHNPLSSDTRFGGRLAADSQATFEHDLPRENLYSVLRRLASALPPGPGVLVANDWLELVMASRHDTGKSVVQILHGDDAYYYDLAVRHERAIDAFVAYSRAMHEGLARALPHRRDSILHLPYGIPIPSQPRTASPGRLRLAYIGRLEQGQKGIFDLPEIDRELAGLGVEVAWTIAGDGPDAAELRRRWQGPAPLRWLGAIGGAAVQELLLKSDVFVLPTRSEGFSVALLEAMAAGLVPVVSDIASGMPEVVAEGVTGFRPPVGDTAAFARAIAALARDRSRLAQMSAAARAEVAGRFEVRERTAAYQALYARLLASRRPRPTHLPITYGSRLDQPWLPNPLVRGARSLLSRLIPGRRGF